MAQRWELPLLLLWILLLGPLASQLLISLSDLPPTASLELGKILLSTLTIFALPSLFFPIGREARHRLFGLIDQNWLAGRALLHLLLVSLGSLLLAEVCYELFLYLGKLIGYTGGDLVTERVRQLLRSGVSPFLCLWITLAVVPAISEELCFRGMLQPLITRLLPISSNRHLPWLLTALLFSLLHFSPIGFVSRFILGYTLSYLTSATGRLYAPILLHLVNNTLALLFLYL